MANSWFVYWSKDRCDHIKKRNQVGVPLNLMFGGPHLSHPSPRRFKVKEGDLVYPVHVSQGVLYILARMRVKQLLTLEDYLATEPPIFAQHHKKDEQFNILTWGKSQPDLWYLAPTCTDDVLIGEDGTMIRFDQHVPSDMLVRLHFPTKQGERIFRVDNGLLKSLDLLQGLYRRLSEESANEIDTLFTVRGVGQ